MEEVVSISSLKQYHKCLCKQATKLLGLQWQGAPSKDVPGNTGFDSQGEQHLASVHASTHEPD
ncbi:hypothetical protein MTR_2g096125 [Medicago truncatula]|uniref:Uncharacterized protein n=1 Tax=Medicago truncatula TaxID=3880 RepID=A0A072VBN4_MEDTR|nr:hypothetical protein MTR_2g096125 [Medicago truncatula]